MNNKAEITFTVLYLILAIFFLTQGVNLDLIVVLILIYIASLTAIYLIKKVINNHNILIERFMQSHILLKILIVLAIISFSIEMYYRSNPIWTTIIIFLSIAVYWYTESKK